MICEKRKSEIESLAKELWERKYHYIRSNDTNIWLEAESQIVCKYWQKARRKVILRRKTKLIYNKLKFVFGLKWLIDYLEG